MLPLDGNRDPKIRERARKGIPNSMRCLVWQRLAKCKVCPATYKGDKQKWFYEILQMNLKEVELQQIVKDITRSMPDHMYFKEDEGQG